MMEGKKSWCWEGSRRKVLETTVLQLHLKAGAYWNQATAACVLSPSQSHCTAERRGPDGIVREG